MNILVALGLYQLDALERRGCSSCELINLFRMHEFIDTHIYSHIDAHTYTHEYRSTSRAVHILWFEWAADDHVQREICMYVLALHELLFAESACTIRTLSSPRSFARRKSLNCVSSAMRSSSQLPMRHRGPYAPAPCSCCFV